jgi:uncharacterized SAM-binding protein YcdF (DUF218 family)
MYKDEEYNETTMVRYDIIIVLGNGFLDDWSLPEHVKQRLILCFDVCNAGFAPTIGVSGKWSLGWDGRATVPPTTEAEAMRQFLVSLGMSDDKIVKEEMSKDTIANAYYLKKNIIIPHNCKKILVLCSDFDVSRVEYIFFKVFGSQYTIDILATHTMASEDLVDAQLVLLDELKEFLHEMKPGDEAFLDEVFYSHSFYQKQRPLIEKAALGDVS